MTGSGYEGHYFWDSEVYVAPFLSYTRPELARNLMHFRSRMLPAARDRARELSQRGALFPWRTINGEEASAYYAAGTAQVHIDADVVHALVQYVNATGDVGFLVRDGLAILVETARLYADLGFWRSNGERSFHIHGVTGPDEYTTVVNNNLFTNVMARYNLEQAVQWVEWTRAPGARRVRPDRAEAAASPTTRSPSGRPAPRACTSPSTRACEIHPQDDFFLDREVWDLSRTPEELRPLLLHYHPLVIYRFQVLKQADVVLALFLQGNRFTAQEKRKDFEYYDPITTGDSTLSAVVQSVIAAEVGYHEVAYGYFLDALYVDLANLHDNTVDGLHVASTGGVWSALVNGFGGMRDHDGRLSFDPRLPDGWQSLTFRITWRGTRMRVTVTPTALAFDVEAGELPVPVEVQGTTYAVDERERVVIPLDGHGPRIPGTLGNRPQTGGTRADGSRITAGRALGDPARGRGAPGPRPGRPLPRRADGHRSRLSRRRVRQAGTTTPSSRWTTRSRPRPASGSCVRHDDRRAVGGPGPQQARARPRGSRGRARRSARPRGAPGLARASPRATATRCCWPPESSSTRWPCTSARPTAAEGRGGPQRRPRGVNAAREQRAGDVLVGGEHGSQAVALGDDGDPRRDGGDEAVDAAPPHHPALAGTPHRRGPTAGWSSRHRSAR